MRVLFLLLALNVLVYSQSFTVRGRVVDTHSSPLELANIMLLYSVDSSIVKGTSSDNAGQFILTALNPGKYVLKISYLGYETYYKNLELRSSALDLGDIILRTSKIDLAGVMVTSNIGVTKISPGAITYNTADLTAQRNGTGGDILKNMPSVYMGGSPNHNRDVRFRGLGNAYTKVLIDGKESGIQGNNRETVIDMLPANQIAYIEILSNPSAEYDSEGINGLINIVTRKKGLPKTWSLNTSASVDNNEGFSTDLSLNYNFSSVNLYADYSRLNRLIDNIKDGVKSNFKNGTFDGQEVTSVQEDKSFKNDFLKGGVNLLLGENSNLLFESTYSRQNESKEKKGSKLNLKSDLSFKDNTVEINDEEKNNYFNEYYTEFTNYFSDYSELKIYAGLNFSNQDKLARKNEYKYNEDGSLKSPNPVKKDESEIIDERKMRTGLSYKFSPFEKTEIKVGFLFTSDKRDALKEILEYDYKTESWKTSASNQDNFNLREDIYAFYTDTKINVGNLSLRPGIRIESTNLNSDSFLDTLTVNSDYLLLLPNLNMIYNLSENEFITLGIGRRLRRPGFKDLNPFIDDKDPSKIKTGNPNLRPEKAWVAEVGYMRNFKNFNVGSNIFYRKIDDVIQKLISENDSGIVFEKPVNLSRAYLFGVELLTAVKPFKWFQLNANYSWFDSEITDVDFEGEALNDQVKWTAKIIADFSFDFGLNAQLTANFIGPKPATQKSEDKITYADLGLSQKIYENGKIYLRISDIFDSLKKVKRETTDKSTKIENENTTGRIINLGFQWNF
ncbi:TonB-dependent receptor [Melioribacter sp. Ez-97]|uniref:TonB-dependent receptor n=1 Tax=Melioribacter sp. Ez-97 TaxID=3423434 RepID=UPI003EDB0B18